MATQKNILDSEGLKHLLSQLHERQVWDKGLSELDFTQTLKDTYDAKPSTVGVDSNMNPTEDVGIPPKNVIFKDDKTNKALFPVTSLNNVVDFPKGTKKGQILTYDGTNPVWADTISEEVMLNTLTYGIGWDFLVDSGADPVLQRLGSPELHKTLPIQSLMRGCIYQPALDGTSKGKFIKWLNPGDWTKRDSLGYYQGSGDHYLGHYRSQKSPMLKSTKGTVRFNFWFLYDTTGDGGKYTSDKYDIWFYTKGSAPYGRRPCIYNASELSEKYKYWDTSMSTTSYRNFNSKWDGRLCISGLVFQQFFLNEPSDITSGIDNTQREPTDLNPVALKGMNITIVSGKGNRHTYKVLDVILMCNSDHVYNPSTTNYASTPVTIVLADKLEPGSEEYTDVITDGQYFLVEECLNGYYGQIKVSVPDFYLKSWEFLSDWGVGGMKGQVRASLHKIDDTWTHQPAMYVDAYRCSVLNEVPENMGYLSTLPLNTAVSIVNDSTYCRGGNNDSSKDNINIMGKRILGVPRTNLTLNSWRTSARQGGQEIMTFNQYKNLAWLYFIEYASFNCDADFNPNLTSEGYHQGGLGPGCIGLTDTELNTYNGRNPMVPNGYTNTLGNGTGVKNFTIFLTDTDYKELQAIRWRGIENIWGDIRQYVDGIYVHVDEPIREPSGNTTYYHRNTHFYTSDDPSNFGLTIWAEVTSRMDFAGSSEVMYSNTSGLNGFKGVTKINLGDKAGFTPQDHAYYGANNQYYDFSSATSTITNPYVAMGTSSSGIYAGTLMGMDMSSASASKASGIRTVCLA